MNEDKWDECEYIKNSHWKDLLSLNFDIKIKYYLSYKL